MSLYQKEEGIRIEELFPKLRRQIVEPFFGFILLTLRHCLGKQGIKHLVSFTDNTTKYFLMSQYKFLMEDSPDYLEILEHAEQYLDNRFCNMSTLESEFNQLDQNNQISLTHLALSIIGNWLLTVRKLV